MTTVSATPICSKPASKPPAEVHGRCRVLLRPGNPNPESIGKIQINGQEYLCQILPSGFRLCGKVDDQGDPVVYDLPADLSSCDCPDATYRPRPGGCKHAAAIRALKAAGQL